MGQVKWAAALAALLALLALAGLLAPPAGLGSSPTPLRVGLVLSVGPGDPFEGIAFAGFRRAVRELGVEGEALTAGAREGYGPTFAYFARKRYDLVIGLGIVQADAIDASALRYPGTRFAAVDVPWVSLPHRPANVQGTVYRVEQPAFLAGYLAALMERRQPGKHVVSAVGGFRIVTVDRFIAGFRAGALKADRHVAVLVDYSNDFIDEAKCKRVALSQIARGSGVVFQVAGGCGLGALQAAKEKGVWGIGVDSDQSALGGYILTSVIKRVDVATFETIRSLRDGTFRPGRSAVFDLARGGVGLGKVSPKVPRAFVTKVEWVRQQIISGKISVPTVIRQKPPLASRP